MESNLKVFESLNCPHCKSPYSKSGSGPKSPVSLCCGEVVCRECWKKEKPLTKEKRQHQCEWKWDCYKYDQPALFLLEILNNPSITASPNGTGYLLSKSLEVPECPVCHEEYSMEVEETKPRVLFCGHLICLGCFMVIRTDSGHEICPHRVQCPRCPGLCDYPFSTQKNPLQEFLQELPEMTRQMRLIERKKCEEKECQREDSTRDLFYCKDHQMTICFRCDYRRHKDCETVEIHRLEVVRIFDDLNSSLRLSFSPKLSEENKKIQEKLNFLSSEIAHKMKHNESISLSEALDQEQEYKKVFDHIKSATDEFTTSQKLLLTKIEGLRSKLSTI